MTMENFWKEKIVKKDFRLKFSFFIIMPYVRSLNASIKLSWIRVIWDWMNHYALLISIKAIVLSRMTYHRSVCCRCHWCDCDTEVALWSRFSAISSNTFWHICPLSKQIQILIPSWSLSIFSLIYPLSYRMLTLCINCCYL